MSDEAVLDELLAALITASPFIRLSIDVGTSSVQINTRQYYI